MFIRIVSDIHVEFIPLRQREDYYEVIVPYLKDEKDMVLVLAGDITTIDVMIDATPWIKDLAQRHKAVIYVMGNHEAYHGSRAEAHHYWHYIAAKYDNLYVLENESVHIDDVRFLGTSLFTKLDPLAESKVLGMSDFDLTKGWTVAQWKYTHQVAMDFLLNALEKDFDCSTVVVTHHLPSFQSVPEYFKRDPLSCGYYTDLDGLFHTYPIKLWCHGHTHASMDYNIADTRIVCNPHGYFTKNRVNKTFNPSLTVEV